MKTTTILATLLASTPLALAGDLCLSSACTLAPPDQGPACGWYQMWSPGNEVCGAGSQEISTGTYDDLEELLTANGGMILNDICGVMVGLSWVNGGPELTYINVEGGMTYNIPADNIENADTAVCDYSGTDCGNAGPIFGRWYWPDLPIC